MKIKLSQTFSHMWQELSDLPYRPLKLFCRSDNFKFNETMS